LTPKKVQVLFWNFAKPNINNTCGHRNKPESKKAPFRVPFSLDYLALK